MGFLGNVKEGVQKARFHLKSDKPLVPASVFMTLSVPPDPPAGLAVASEPDTDSIPNNEFKNSVDVDVTDKNLGIAIIQYGGTDTTGRVAVRSDTFRVASSYGRNYGEDYGNGL